MIRFLGLLGLLIRTALASSSELKQKLLLRTWACGRQIHTKGAQKPDSSLRLGCVKSAPPHLTTNGLPRCTSRMPGTTRPFTKPHWQTYARTLHTTHKSQALSSSQGTSTRGWATHACPISRRTSERWHPHTERNTTMTAAASSLH